MAKVVLIGFMGAGKSTIGKLLSEELHEPFIDIDKALEKKIELSIPAYFKRYGEKQFREVERKMLEESVVGSGILATGGGIVLAKENRRLLLAQPFVVYLELSGEKAYERISHDQNNQRPLAKSGDQASLIELLASRQKLYEESCHFKLNTEDLTPTEVVKCITSELVKRKRDEQ